jgi:hypothetical protein
MAKEDDFHTYLDAEIGLDIITSNFICINISIQLKQDYAGILRLCEVRGRQQEH